MVDLEAAKARTEQARKAKKRTLMSIHVVVVTPHDGEAYLTLEIGGLFERAPDAALASIRDTCVGELRLRERTGTSVTEWRKS